MEEKLCEFDGIFKLFLFDKVNLIFRLLIFDISDDVDGWIKLTKRKERNITFFDKPEINFKI